MAKNSKWFTEGLTTTKVEKLEKMFGQIIDFSIELCDKQGLQMNMKLKLDNGLEVKFCGGNSQDIEQIMYLTGARANYHMRNKFVEVYLKDSVVQGLSVNEHFEFNGRKQ